MRIVQQFDLVAMVGAQLLEQARHDAEVARRGPYGFGGQLAFGRFVRLAADRNAVGLLDAWHAALRANGDKAHFAETAHFVAGFGDIAPVGMPVHQRTFA